jgi:hypothetical protein
VVCAACEPAAAACHDVPVIGAADDGDAQHGPSMEPPALPLYHATRSNCAGAAESPLGDVVAALDCASAAAPPLGDADASLSVAGPAAPPTTGAYASLNSAGAASPPLGDPHASAGSSTSCMSASYTFGVPRPMDSAAGGCSTRNCGRARLKPGPGVGEAGGSSGTPTTILQALTT